MSYFKDRKLVLHTGEKQFNWRHRHEQSWYKKLPFFLRNCYDFMIDKQRRGFLILGLLAVVTFFVSLQTLSVGLFLLHLVIDILFGVYAYASFQVRAASIQRRNVAFMNDVTFEDESIEYLKQAV